jgi:hypothetical protein
MNHPLPEACEGMVMATAARAAPTAAAVNATSAARRVDADSSLDADTVTTAADLLDTGALACEGEREHIERGREFLLELSQQSSPTMFFIKCWQLRPTSLW